jgi:hypothetical protein
VADALGFAANLGLSDEIVWRNDPFDGAFEAWACSQVVAIHLGEGSIFGHGRSLVVLDTKKHGAALQVRGWAVRAAAVACCRGGAGRASEDSCAAARTTAAALSGAMRLVEAAAPGAPGGGGADAKQAVAAAAVGVLGRLEPGASRGAAARVLDQLAASGVAAATHPPLLAALLGAVDTCGAAEGELAACFVDGGAAFEEWLREEAGEEEEGGGAAASGDGGSARLALRGVPAGGAPDPAAVEAAAAALLQAAV